ncbi:MAG: tRNA uracil 4-sulfurtransferase ThiI [Myxococcota bacterium]
MGGAPDLQLALLRFSGDVGTKARATRFRFQGRLLQNLRDALRSAGVAPRVRVSRDRIFVEVPNRAAVEALARVFGVQSISLVECRTATRLEEITSAGEELFRERVRGRRFAVRARRVGNRNRIPVSAREVERTLGAALLPVSAGVDLGDPEVTARVEIGEGEAYFFSETTRAHGGLPLGVEGRALALISGGFDSAVAAWHLLKRGVALDYAFCNLGGATHQLGALRVAKVLADRWSYGDRPQLHAVDFSPLVEELQTRTQRRYWQVLLKRQMLRAADSLARARRAEAIVTGEVVGQVSSQTLRNLAVISRASSAPILRPLVGFNKEEIIAVAQRIGTFELSKVVGEYCAMVPQRPATGASERAVLEQERQLDPSLLERAVAGCTVFDLRSLDLEKLELPDLEVERIPEGATLLDLRSKADYERWHHADALRMDFPQALRAYPNFDRSVVYVLYCEIGLKSAHLAELMREAGFDAYHFKGGQPALAHRVAAARR